MGAATAVEEVDCCYCWREERVKKIRVLMMGKGKYEK